MIKVNSDGLNTSLDWQQKKDEISAIVDGMQKKSLVGSDYLGWLDYLDHMEPKLIQDILADARYIQENYEVLVVCGIGGSYLGSRAVIEAVKGVGPGINKGPEIIFFGNTFSATYTKQVLDYLKDKKFFVNVISKSGTTTETSIAFRLLRQLMQEKYDPATYRKSIIATTDQSRGLLRKLADSEGYKTYVMPDDVGGRYSVFTPVGLLPIATAGIDIEALIKGARDAKKRYLNTAVDNPMLVYAYTRNYMYSQEKLPLELYTFYEPQLQMLGEWLKQLFGESEGKERKGLFPASVVYSTDLHSLGQFIQEGSPVVFETNIRVEKSLLDVAVPKLDSDLDELDYLSGKSVNYVNEQAFLGTKAAHVKEGKVNNIDLVIADTSPSTIGELLYFMMLSCAVSSYLLDINPFNQPGVEVYKRNMFALLGKPKSSKNNKS